jgi:A/G-specific adenine glycosylase
MLKGEQLRTFRKIVYENYRAQGRDLPWRKTSNAYKILVSEIMLQQTQVSRVLEKYEEFLSAFPDVESLAKAPLREVLAIWHGLGYNRRALALKKTAEEVIARYQGMIPSNIESLRSLPGIGEATASAICVFAFNQPVEFIETNIRSAFIHHFFRKKHKVRDSEIRTLVEQTLDRENPRIWYHALMDYGATLKKMHRNPSRTSTHYRRQGKFKGSNRQIRGLIIRTLLKKESISEHDLIKDINFTAKAVRLNLERLEKEGLIVRTENSISIT